MEPITRDELRRMMQHEPDLTLVETLGEEQYNEFHLPGAVNIPAADARFADKFAAAVPDKAKPVVVYCYDLDCTASPKAARKLDDLGYVRVYDYEAGKMDWKEAGLPIES